MALTRPRPIGIVDVKLLDNIFVKKFDNITVKNIYSSILKNTELHTDLVQEYFESLINIETNKEKDNVKPLKRPKHFIRNITLIGNAAISTPTTPDFGVFPARLKNYNKTFTGDRVVESASDLGWFDKKVGDSFLVHSRQGNTKNKVNGGGVSPLGAFQTARPIGELFNTSGRSTTVDNTWIPTNDGEDTACGFHETVNGIAKYVATVQNPLQSQIKSNFKLRKNQPFSFKFQLFDFSTEQKVAFTANLPSLALAGALGVVGSAGKFHPHVVVSWGGGRFLLKFFRDGRVTLTVDGKKLENEWKIPGKLTDNKNGTQITVYPLGSYIYVYAGDPSTEDTIKGLYKAFNLRKALQIPEGEIVLDFLCGKAVFNFSSVIHPKSGLIFSPLVGGGFVPKIKVVSLTYLGKFGVGARESPIMFPDENDKDQLFGYLKGNEITYEIEEEDAGVLRTVIKLKLPKDDTVYDEIRADINEVVDGLLEEATNKINGFPESGETSNDVADALKNKATVGFNKVFEQFQSGLQTAYTNAQKVFGDAIGAVTDSFLQAFDNMQVALAGGNLNAAGQEVKNGARKQKGVTDAFVANNKIIAVSDNIYSPALFLSQLTLVPEDPEAVGLQPKPQIENSDVIGVTVNQAVEQNKATVTLNNRRGCSDKEEISGRYTFIPGENNFAGIKPIQIKMAYEGEQGDNELPIVFTGFVTNRSYSRSAPGHTSTCTLQCEDMSKKAREQFAVNLPFFDGWCHLAVIHYLAKEAGYTDDEILLEEDPRTGRRTRVRDLLIGDPDTFTGGCFDGHINEDPPGNGVLPGAYLHMTLPLAALGIEEPNYNFSFGTPLWTCMMRVREFTNFFLFANNFGNIIYGPPKSVIKEVGFEFKEVDVMRDYNEFQRQLNVNFDTADLRNAVFLQGITFLPNQNIPGGGNWSTHVHVRRKDNFPNDIEDPSFAPWNRYTFLRNPKWEFPQLAALAAEEIFRRVTRLKFNADYGAWGQPTLFPYDVIKLNEEQLNETGVNQKEVVIAAHTLTANIGTYQLESNFSTEARDPIAENFDPNLPSAIRE